jgi:hypothetical protein
VIESSVIFWDDAEEKKKKSYGTAKRALSAKLGTSWCSASSSLTCMRERDVLSTFFSLRATTYATKECGEHARQLTDRNKNARFLLSATADAHTLARCSHVHVHARAQAGSMYACAGKAVGFGSIPRRPGCLDVRVRGAGKKKKLRSGSHVRAVSISAPAELVRVFRFPSPHSRGCSVLGYPNQSRRLT